MKEELEKKLVEKYPNLFRDYGGDPRQTCMAWGMSHGNGWYQILEDVCEKIKDTETVFLQIKEKFGALNIYYTCPNDEDNLVGEVINEAYRKSLETCEICGERGKRNNDDGWLMSLCKKCEAARKVERERR